MRILVINYEYPPIGAGGGDVSKCLAEGFARLGHPTVVLTAHWDRLPRRDKPRSNLAVHRVFAFRRAADRCTPPQMLAFMLMGLPAAVSLVRRFRPDVVHAHFLIPVGPQALALRGLFRVPYVVTCHGGDVGPEQTGLYYYLSKPMAALVARRAAACVAVSKDLTQKARRLFPGARVEYIPNGVDVNQFQPAAERRHASPVRFVFAGRFSTLKALDRLIEAARRLLDAGTCGFEIMLYGGGPMEEALRRQVAEARLDGVVHFCGWVDRAALAGALAEAHAFVLPSDIEGMPIACLQAMASGLAIIGSRIAGIQDVVTDGGNGILTPAGDVDALAAAMQRLITDRQLLNQMGQHSRVIAVESFSWEAIIERYLALFQRVIRQ
ncbi:MAG: glycosyltransferase family 4 protein [Candidatus Sumerlaeia bacterium]